MAALSPSVETREVDRTLSVTNITSNATGYVGAFKWGPVESVSTITTNEAELVRKLGKQDKKTALYFYSALNYLLYVAPLLIVRATGPAAKNAVPTTKLPIIVKNDDYYDNVDLSDYAFVARYPGELGNNLEVHIADSEGFATWDYASYFNYAPENDEINLVVVDAGGDITGIKGSVIEQYELLTFESGTRKPDGTSAYIKKVLRSQSNWILAGDDLDDSILESGVAEVKFQGGVDDNEKSNVDFVTAWETFTAKERYNIIRAFTSGNDDIGIKKAIDVADSLESCIVFYACQSSDVIGAMDPVGNLVTYFGNTINKPSSYSFKVDNWKQVYDKYGDKYIWIPCDSDAAALHARTAVQNEAWFSPAGMNRGQLKNVIRLAWNSDQPQRDILYKNGINSIVSFENEGIVLWGDKTGLMRPSAFSRINVRTLFIILRQNIAYMARYQLFEFNDYITRTTFKRATDQYLETVQSRRGIYDFRVVADETNNTPQIIDDNEFVGDIYIQPARVINNIRLSFICTPTGVSFEEIEG